METKEYEEQLMIRRSRLKFSGFAYDPSVKYKIELALSNRDHGGGHIDESNETANIVFDAVLMWEFSDGWELWLGQTKLPGNRERVISSQKLQFVNRSLVNSRFTLDRDIGVQIHHKSGSDFVFKQALAISTGEGRNITAVNPSNGREFTGRLEFLPFGDFTSKGDYFGSDLKRESSPKLSFGITGDVNNNAVRQRGNLGGFLGEEEEGYTYNDLQTLMLDMIFKYQGWSIASEYANRQTRKENNGFATGTGLVVQSGYLLPSNWEFALRYTVIDALHLSSLNDETEYTIGISKYVKGHNLKIQSDFSYKDLSGRDNTTVFRLQTEMAF